MPRNQPALLPGCVAARPSHLFSAFPNMATSNTLTADETRGEITLPIGGESYLVRFGLRFLRAFTTEQGADGPAGGLASLETAPIDALLQMVALGVRLSVPTDKLPAGFDADAAADVLEALPAAEQERVFAVLISSIKANPIVGALKQVKA